MKRLLSFLLLLIMLCTPLLVACGKEETPEITENGEEELLEESPHAFGAWVVVTAPTCTTKGTKTRRCSCGAEETTEMPEQHVASWEMTLLPTKTENGLATVRCTLCGALVERSGKVLPAGMGEESGRWLDDLDQYNLNYGYERISILHCSDVEFPEFEQTELTGDNVLDAIYTRNLQVEYRLNVDLVFTGKKCATAADREAFVNHVDAVYKAGAQWYDVIAASSRTEASLAVRGLLQDLSQIQNSYIDLEKPWWPDHLVETVTFGNGSCYFLSGDMSTNVLQMMECIFFNKDLMRELQLEFPYNDVYDGEWTLDRLIALAGNAYYDLDGSASTSAGDRFGLCVSQQTWSAFYTGANMRYVDPSEPDMMLLSSDYGSQKATALVQKLGGFAASDSVWSYSDGNATEPFLGGRALFCAERAGFMQTHSTAGFDYGLLPMPKYDEGQLNYYTSLADGYVLYGVFADFDDRGNAQGTLSMLSAVFECYASESYRLTTP